MLINTFWLKTVYSKEEKKNPKLETYALHAFDRSTEWYSAIFTIAERPVSSTSIYNCFSFFFFFKWRTKFICTMLIRKRRKKNYVYFCLVFFFFFEQQPMIIKKQLGLGHIDIITYKTTENIICKYQTYRYSIATK